MKAVIIYDDCERAKQANALLCSASDRAASAIQWHVRPWRLDMLLTPRLAEEALVEAAEAHLIVLAVGPDKDSETVVLTWLQQWAERRQVEDAALARFDGASGEAFANRATPRMLSFAQRHGLNFILGDVHPDEDKSDWLSRDSVPEQITPVSSVLSIL